MSNIKKVNSRTNISLKPAIAKPTVTTSVPTLPTATGYPEPWSEQPPTLPYGRTGIQRFGGYDQEDYQGKLQGRAGILKYDEMYRSDPQVYASINRMKMKLKSAKWAIESADEDNPEENEIARAVEKCFISGTNKIWLDNLNDILSFIKNGFAVFEPTWEVKDDMWVIKSYNWRNPKTLWQFFVVDDKIWSIRQISYGDDYTYIDIPGSEMLVFTYDKEGNHFEGISPLRPMYPSFYRKDQFHIINALGVVNNARGMWDVEVPATSIDSKAHKNMRASLLSFTNGNIPWIERPTGWPLKYNSTQYQADAVLKSINSENASISKVLQEEQMELGLTSENGSRAVAQSKQDESDISVKVIAQYICDNFQGLIERFIKLNFGEREKYPKMIFSGVDTKNTMEEANKRIALANAGFIDPYDPLVRAWIRKDFDIPGGDEIEEAGDKNLDGIPDAVQLSEKEELKEHKSLLDKLAAAATKGGYKITAKQIAALIDKDHKKLAEFGGPGSGRRPESGRHPQQSVIENYKKLVKNLSNMDPIIDKEYIRAAKRQLASISLKLNLNHKDIMQFSESESVKNKEFGGPGSGRRPEGAPEDDGDVGPDYKAHYDGLTSGKYKIPGDLLEAYIEHITQPLDDYKENDKRRAEAHDKIVGYLIDKYGLSASEDLYYAIANYTESVIDKDKRQFATKLNKVTKFGGRLKLNEHIDTQYEAKVQFAELEKKFDDTSYVKFVRDSLKNIVIPKYKEDLKLALKQPDRMSAVTKIKMGYQGSLASKMLDRITDSIISGREAALHEVQSSKQFAQIADVKKLPPGVYSWAKSYAELNAETSLNDLKKKFTYAAINGINNEMSDDEIVFNTIEEGEDFIDEDRHLGAGIVTTQAVNEGRFSLFQEYSDQIQGFQFSAKIETACDLCESLDGNTFEIDDPNNIDLDPPLHPQCKCILVPILLDEETPEWTGRNEGIDSELLKNKKLGECTCGKC